MHPLSPSLSVIENTLFSPSDELIQRWLEGDKSLPHDTVAALERDPVACALRAERLQAAFQDAPAPPEQPLRLPAWLHELFARRTTARAHRFSPKPKAGQILRVDQAIGPQGPLPWDFNCPLAVLIAEPTEVNNVWYGWLAASETDYASPWDLLLEEQDEPYDPLVSLVQVWNPTHVYIPSTRIVLAELQPQRLATLRSLASDLLAGMPSDPALARPGALVERLTQDGCRVMTGTPLGGPNDPRWRYQELYFAAAGLLRDLAKLALAESVSLLERLLARLKQAADTWNLSLEPVAVPVLGEATATAVQAYRLSNLVDLQVVSDPDQHASKVQITLLGNTPLTVKVVRGGRVRQQQRLTDDRRQADFYLERSQGLALVIEDAQGMQQFQCEWDT